LPALSRAKAKARQIQCVNDLKQLTLATFMYSNDTGKTLSYNDPNYQNGVWMGTLIDYYAKVDQVRICPVTRDPSPLPAADWQGAADRTWGRVATLTSGNKKTFTGSFGYNGFLYYDLAARGKEHPEWAFQKESAIQKPTLTPVLVDCMWVDLWPYETDPPARDLYLGDYTQGGMGRCTIARHGGVVNAPRSTTPGQKLPGSVDIGLKDGHVEMVKLDNLWNYYWHKDWIPPGIRPQ
jgi:hypothetical protein